MTERLQDTVNVLVPTGALGAGVRESDVAAGLAAGAHAIACDAGSTDSGPPTSRPAAQVLARCRQARPVHPDAGQAKANMPLLIGSCGTSGCDEALDWTRDIALEIAREHGLRRASPCSIPSSSPRDGRRPSRAASRRWRR
jgi:hypothetical protein